MTAEELNKLYVELEEEEQKVEIEYCKMFNSTPDEVPLNQMVRFRSGYCMGKHYGYLAGLKAGRPQWHDLRKDPNDLPKRDIRFSTHISIPILTQTSGFAFYQFDDKKWYFQGKEIYVIAWCEIPQFKE